MFWRDLAFKTQQVRHVQGNKPQCIIENEQGKSARAELERTE